MDWLPALSSVSCSPARVASASTWALRPVVSATPSWNLLSPWSVTLRPRSAVVNATPPEADDRRERLAAGGQRLVHREVGDGVETGRERAEAVLDDGRVVRVAAATAAGER